MYPEDRPMREPRRPWITWRSWGSGRRWKRQRRASMSSAGKEEASVSRERGSGKQATRAREEILPSLMLATPGCWACEEMGALVAGVF